MEDDHDSICKCNQTGYCKFREHCRKKHDNIICDKRNECTTEKCIKRHPKMCKNYMKNNKCRFNSDCAYSHEDSEDSQTKLNDQFKLAMVKHEKDIQFFLKDILNIKTAQICRLNNTSEAETCKILENTYRALNNAFIEEWRNFSSILNLDLNKILDFIRLRPTHSNIMRPGIGVGGYCLTKDPLFAEISSKYICLHK